MKASSKKRIIAIAAVVMLLALLVVYFFFDPANSYFAPKCPFKLLTGLDCPACGGQRALHSLLNGDLYASFLYNPFLWLMLPYVSLVVYVSLCKSPRSQRIARYVTHRYTIFAYIALFFIWWVVRNTQWWHSIVEII